MIELMKYLLDTKMKKILEAKFKPLREYNGDNVCEYYDELIE